MRNRFFILSTALLILALAVPATAGGPNDNGNGMRTVYVERDDADTDLYMPICEGGAQVGVIREIPAHLDTVLSIRAKADGSRVEYLRVSHTVSNDGSYRLDYREHQVVNSIDVGGTGLPNVYNENNVTTWSDPDGNYAEETRVYHARYDKDGNYTFDSHLTGLVCLRDTIIP